MSSRDRNQFDQRTRAADAIRIYVPELPQTPESMFGSYNPSGEVVDAVDGFLYEVAPDAECSPSKIN